MIDRKSGIRSFWSILTHPLQLLRKTGYIGAGSLAAVHQRFLLNVASCIILGNLFGTYTVTWHKVTENLASKTRAITQYRGPISCLGSIPFETDLDMANLSTAPRAHIRFTCYMEVHWSKDPRWYAVECGHGFGLELVLGSTSS